MSGLPPEEPQAGSSGDADADGAPAQVAGASALAGGIGRAVRAGASGEQLTAAGVLGAIGGVRGVLETIVPSLLFLGIFVPTGDARLSAIIPGSLAVLLVIVRIVRREPVVSALSGMLGVGIAVLITLITGRGVDFYLSGFVVNVVWGIGLLVSIIVGWPAVGLIIGVFRGDLRSWRRIPGQRRVALWLTVLWLALFVARLAVQLPMYLAGQVGLLGTARIVMGVPLFAAVIVVTWVVVQRTLASSDDSSSKNGVISGENTPGE